MSVSGLGGTNYPTYSYTGQNDTINPPQKTDGLNRPHIISDEIDPRNQQQTQNNDSEIPLPSQPSGKSSTEVLHTLNNLSDAQVSTDIYEFMAVFQQLAQQMRNTARTQRASEMQSQVTALQDAAAKMKEAAAERFSEAIVQGAVQIAGGVMQIGFSAASAKKTIEGVKLQAQGNRLEAQGKKLEADGESSLDMNIESQKMIRNGGVAKANGEMVQGVGEGLSGLIKGMGSMIGASYRNKADLLDADKANLETEAKVHETAVQHANDMMQQMMDVIRDVREKLQGIQQAQIETNRGIARNI